MDEIYNMYEKAKIVMPDMDMEYFDGLIRDAYNQDKWNYKQNIKRMFEITV